MKKLSIIMAVMAVCGLVVFACGDDGDKGPHCEAMPCDGACDIMAGEWCCGGSCEPFATCDPACDAATEYCDPCGAGCTAIPDVVDCDPACGAGEWCDTSNGSCQTIPVCDPVCGDTEVCVD